MAELGVNHDGDADKAAVMIRAAQRCGCDAVKVQSYECADFLPRGHPDWEMFERCSLTLAEVAELRRLAADYGLLFGSTPSSVLGVNVLAEMRVDFLKNGSDYLLRTDVIQAMARTGIPTVLATGMGSLDEIRNAAKAFRSAGGRDLTMLVCTSAYPCPDAEANLRRLENACWPLFGAKVGFSDHTRGDLAAYAATALGATMIEKHFTLDTLAPGPDHWFSADEAEMGSLVRGVRIVEQMLGTLVLTPTLSERQNMGKWRVLEGKKRAA